MEKDTLTYDKAIEELEELLENIENRDIYVDELSENIKRAALLINFCKKKLKETEENIENILKEI